MAVRDFVARQTLNGLGTFSLFTAPSTPATGFYFVDGQLTIPDLSTGSTANSACLATIKVNGTGAYTGVAGAKGFQTNLTLSAGDAVTVVLSSSAAVDAPLNVIKGVVSISAAV